MKERSRQAERELTHDLLIRSQCGNLGLAPLSKALVRRSSGGEIHDRVPSQHPRRHLLLYTSIRLRIYVSAEPIPVFYISGRFYKPPFRARRCAAHCRSDPNPPCWYTSVKYSVLAGKLSHHSTKGVRDFHTIKRTER